MIQEIFTKFNSFELYTIFKDDSFSFILDSGMDPNRLGRYSFISSNPFKVIKVYKNTTNPFDILKEELNKYKIKNSTHLPFIGGAVGYLSYDLYKFIEKIPGSAIDDVNIPLLYLGLYNWVIVVDHLENRTYIATPDIDKKLENIIVKKVLERIKNAEINGIDSICYQNKEYPEVILKSNFTKKEYLQSIERIRDYIRAGDVYQVNLTQRFEGKVANTGYEIYRDLRTVSPAPFGAYLKFDEVEILSNSPERFIKVKNGIVETRPIKGTRPRGNTYEEDMRLREELINSEKDKAELLMIVDLERNDIGKVAKVGSVKVPELFKLEKYSNVYHLVSTVIGELDDDKDLVDLLKAVFPGGSITGAPKVRAMEIIDELEPNQRNVYTGCIGYLGFDGSADLNIAIRTIVKKGDRIYFQVGGGITWDSNPDEEYEETLHKAKSIIKAIRGKYEEKSD
ncbi:para-aminobenzoate synthetase component 1 [Caloranaerobacter azorensis DSM 13643]|uniref:aminodeoxychorismate synthase n=1 Tax=Caloranaerobacter azorensis DSM 13643 TaxID=1121264 RepID=A0A1M5WIH5_9FIRM|nr:aminodeoxychorismate synthase component I [Caloranaerobacter azorensis]SHH87349.1 para-aminobenzoate synthetase component 1 [Caloranaerobacter azorensis DSM 13643]